MRRLLLLACAIVFVDTTFFAAMTPLLPAREQAAPRFVCADVNALPFRGVTADLVWSNLALQWVNDLPRAFGELRRVLKVGGLFTFTTFGPDTLRELRRAFAGIDAATHTNRFVDMHDIGDMLVAAGFADPVMDMEHVTLTFESPAAFLSELKAIGAGLAVAKETLRGRTPRTIDRLQARLADRLVFEKVRARLGGRVRYLVSGSAALGADVAEFFCAIGLPIIEGYGLTETAPILTVNPPGATRVGTVGKPIPGVDIRLAPDGEILARGPNLMSGYYNDPEKTARTFLTDNSSHPAMLIT